MRRLSTAAGRASTSSRFDCCWNDRSRASRTRSRRQSRCVRRDRPTGRTGQLQPRAGPRKGPLSGAFARPCRARSQPPPKTDKGGRRRCRWATPSSPPSSRSTARSRPGGSCPTSGSARARPHGRAPSLQQRAQVPGDAGRDADPEGPYHPQQSAAPLGRDDFAVDSSGFATCRYVRGSTRSTASTGRRRSGSRPICACGVKTNVVTAVDIVDEKNSRRLPAVRAAAQDDGRELHGQGSDRQTRRT